MYELRIPQSIKNKIKRLSPRYRSSAISALEDIKDNPNLGKALARELKGFKSYQFGPYRFIYKVDTKGKKVDIVRLGHRRLVYN